MSENKSRYFFLDVIVKESLSIFLIATFILTLVLFFVFAGHDGSYEDFIRSQLITQKNIQLAILIASLCLIMATTLITGLIGLYASFKVAGPLFRFSENISNVLEHKSAYKIREGDYFQELSASMLNSIDKVEAHKQELKLYIERCSEQINNSEPDIDRDELSKLLHHLKVVESRIKLSD